MKTIEEYMKLPYRLELIPDTDEGGFLSAAALSGLDSMQISVFGNEERILLVARYDNLGKGASGAALQCMNIAIGADETLGLILEA
jgi:N-acetyl-gamma-glutamyl-phosphate reductase